MYSSNARRNLRKNSATATSQMHRNAINKSAVGRKLPSRAKSIKISAKHFVTHKKDQALQDEYVVGELLGEGAYGEVYSCCHKETGAERAVKVIPKHNNSNDDAIRNEFQILKMLDHPNCLKQFHLFEDAQNFHIVTDYYAGGELFDVLVDCAGPMGEDQVAALMNNVLSCVNYFHSMGVVHRDLKPENIVLSAPSRLEDCKIIDFGFATVSNGKPLTEIVGTPYYGSPQVFDGQPYTAKADIWSCGIITFLLLSGYVPFDGDSNREITLSVIDGYFDFNDPAWDSISVIAKHFVQQLLSYNERDRPDALQALQHPWLSQKRRDSSTSFRASRTSICATTALQNMERFDAHTKLKQATYALLSSQLLSPAEKEEIDQVFRVVDADCSGKLDRDELKKAFQTYYDKDLTDQEVDSLFNKVNFSGSGSIEYSEFVVACLMESQLLDERKLKAAFKEFDLDGSGSISVDELKAVLSSGSNEDLIDLDLIDKIIQSVDTDGDNEIDFEEFRCMMLLNASQPSKETLSRWKSATTEGDNDGNSGTSSSASFNAPITIKPSFAAASISTVWSTSSSRSDSLSSSWCSDYCTSDSNETGGGCRSSSASEGATLSSSVSKNKKEELEVLSVMMRGNAKARRNIFEEYIGAQARRSMYEERIANKNKKN